MGARPLRQHYDPLIEVTVDDDMTNLLSPWVRHRRRFVAEVSALTDEQWNATTRCTAWDTQDVLAHLVSADGFWVASLTSGAAGAPTAFLDGFDPTTSPQTFVDPMRDHTHAEILAQFDAGTEAFIAAVEALDNAAWANRGEAPVGHLPLPLVLAHALWDSWLHERDILLPLGIDVPVEADELLPCTAYALVMGGLQGGLLGDAAPVGPGLDEPLDVTITFDDLPDDPLHLVVDGGILLERATSDTAHPCGSAVDLIETYTGRAPVPAVSLLPPDLAAHLARARDIL